MILPGNGRLTRGNTIATHPKPPARQVPPGLCKLRAANSPGNATESSPKSKCRVLRLSSPKPVESVVVTAEPTYATTVDSVPKHDKWTTGILSPSANDAACPAPEATSTCLSTDVPKHVTNDASSGRDGCTADSGRGTGREPAPADRGSGREMHRQRDGGVGFDGAIEHFAQQKWFAARGRKISTALPPLPPDAEVLEVSYYLPCELLPLLIRFFW